MGREIGAILSGFGDFFGIHRISFPEGSLLRTGKNIFQIRLFLSAESLRPL